MNKLLEGAAAHGAYKRNSHDYLMDRTNPYGAIVAACLDSVEATGSHGWTEAELKRVNRCVETRWASRRGKGR
ncbi:MAG TPA: hypothetical protein VEB21_00320 [Terriglobales bacterium]|nr:hypothetical protein [Terriglobales bacterium]